jgi:hypothetical protein
LWCTLFVLGICISVGWFLTFMKKLQFHFSSFFSLKKYYLGFSSTHKWKWDFDFQVGSLKIK